TYEMLRAAAAEEAAARPAKKEPAKERPAASGTTKVKRKRKFPYRKTAEIEADIAENETTLQELEQLLASPELYRDGERVKETTRLLEETKLRLQQLYEHWEEAVELN